MKLQIEVSEDIVQCLNRRQRLMDSLEGSRVPGVTLGLIEAENNTLARLVVEAYRKQEGYL